MRILWIGGVPPELSLRQGDSIACCSPSSIAIRDALEQGTWRPEASIALIEMERSGDCGAILERLHRERPRTTVGLVAGNERRAEAFALLRKRQVDRVVPRCDLDSGLRPHIAALASHAARVNTLSDRLESFASKTLFVTGATGFLGGHFLRYLLRCSAARVVVLTRSTPDAPYNERLSHLEVLHPGRIEYVQGDVCQPGLGLSPAQQEWLAETVSEVWHLAANTKFEEILRDEIFRANTEGTRNVIEFARSLPNLKRFHHVSTAYAAGNPASGGLVPEARLARPLSFKNPYEESKHRAEADVAASGLPAIIYRPSIILGERVSGLCDGQTVYKVAQLLRLARLSGKRNSASDAQSFRVVVDPDTTKNLIPADEVVFRMLAIAAGDPAPGSYFNLAHSTATAMEDLIAVIASVLNIPEYEAVSSLEGERLSVSEAVLQRISAVFKPYMLNSDPPFDTRAADKSSGGASIPPVDQEGLRFLLQCFFEQHYGWEFQPCLATA